MEIINHSGVADRDTPRHRGTPPLSSGAATAANSGQTGAAVVFFSSPGVHDWGIRQTELRARFIGLPLTLKLKRGKKPDDGLTSRSKAVGAGLVPARLPLQSRAGTSPALQVNN
jgi:hypothetical protein